MVQASALSGMGHENFNIPHLGEEIEEKLNSFMCVRHEIDSIRHTRYVRAYTRTLHVHMYTPYVLGRRTPFLGRRALPLPKRDMQETDKDRT